MQQFERIPLTGTINTRDFGGIQTTGGHRIKPCRLLRSDHLSNTTAADQAILVNDYRLRLIIDFRTDEERSQAPDPQISGVRYISNPILEDEILGITHEAEGKERGKQGVIDVLSNKNFDPDRHMQLLYRTMGENTFTISQYGKFFSYLLSQNDGATLWHCAVGKDRVGIASALLLKMLGVDDETIYADYMQTNINIAQKLLLEANEFLIDLPEGAEKNLLRERYLVMFSSRPSHLSAFFDSMKSRFGSLENGFSEGLGFSPDKIAQLKAMYLE